MHNTPKLLRHVSNLLVLMGGFSLSISISEFYIVQTGLAFAFFCATALMLLSFIGLRMMKKWSVYIFSGLLLLFMACHSFAAFQGENADIKQLLLSCIVPAFFYSVAIPYWHHFE